MMPRPSERGAALLTVLMLVAVIGVLAAASLERLKLGTRASVNMVAVDQARAYGYAAEAVARSRVADLIARDEAKTTLQGDWLGRAIPFPIEGGTATARIGDGGNCFNLNSLVTGVPATGLSVRPSAVTQLEALMVVLGIRVNDARLIALSLADWIDSDTTPLPGGAEDGRYANRKPAYRTANTLVADASEIRLVEGMTNDIYARVRPWLCALPSAELSPINVNTLLPEQAPLIAMLVPGRLDLRAAKRMIDARPASGYASAVEFWSLPAQSGITPPPEAMQQTQVKTRWFSLDLTVELAGAELREIALIDARVAPPKLVRRSYGDPA